MTTKGEPGPPINKRDRQLQQHAKRMAKQILKDRPQIRRLFIDLIEGELRAALAESHKQREKRT